MLGDFFMAKQEKARYWTAVCYPENMVDDWKETIGDVLGYPYAYCVHDKDNLGEYQQKPGEEYQRKEHVHIVICYANTTTYNSVLSLFGKLSKPDCSCVNTVQSVGNIRHMYEYLIHNTETSKKQKKYIYDISERVTGNNFDIGAYEQLGVQEKNDMAKELCDIIIEQGFTNFVDFYAYVMANKSMEYFEIIKTHSGLYERLTKGNFQKSEYVKGGRNVR